MSVATPPMIQDTRAPASSLAELRALLVLATPLVGANLLQMAVAAVDVVFVSRLGTTEFAAATAWRLPVQPDDVRPDRHGQRRRADHRRRAGSAAARGPRGPGGRFAWRYGWRRSPLR